ncbi:MAG: hypothetical protein NW241_04070 [Bacteroidia bacterium]|nr:hypothetical protein [Bacteroidia bacterium]
MNLYKIVSQLTKEEFSELHKQFLDNKADKSASFLETIRKNPESPEKEFLEKHDVTASAFYVLKSRLNQRIETYILRKVGDPELDVIRRVLAVNDLIFSNTRDISVAALSRLEKELIRLDFPYGLMIVYRELQNLNAFDENHQYYKSRYNQQVAYAIAMDKGVDIVVQFFRAYDNFYLSRKERDYQEMIRQMEKIDNLTNINHDSHRLYIFKAIIHIFAKLFIDIPDTIRCELEETETMFEKAFNFISEYKEDKFYTNIQILFNYLRYIYYDNNNFRDKANMFFGILDEKVDDLLIRYHANVNTSMFLFRKLQYHVQSNTIPHLVREIDQYLGKLEVDRYRISFYVNYQLFLAHAYFADRQYKKASRILYNLRTDVNLRRSTHMDLEVKFFLAASYVLMEDFDLANQLILSLQRQLRKPTLLKNYEHARVLLKILSIALGGKPRTRAKNLRINIDKYRELNKGRYALLERLDLEKLFLREEASSFSMKD